MNIKCLIYCLFICNIQASYKVSIEPAIQQNILDACLKKRKVEVGTLTISPKAKEYVNEVLNSNRLSYGPFCQQFEKKFAKFHEVKFGLVSNSGTSSLQIALQALKELHNWQDGDEVIVPAVTFVATSNIVLHNKMTPVFVDVDNLYYEIDPTKIREKITTRTRAIIPVHLFGQPCDMDPICEIAREYNLKIIEDSCETMLAKYKGKYVGSLGDIGCFSTYVAHLLTTGVGGLSTTNDAEYAVKMRSLLNHGRDSIYISIDDDDNVSGSKLKEIIEKRFSFVSIGHSYRITELEAAIGVAHLDDLPTIVEQRRNNALYLNSKLSDLSDKIQLPSIRPGNEHAFMMYPLVMLHEDKKNIVYFLEQHEIETRDMLPLINQPIYQKTFNIDPLNYPVANWINNNGFYIGSHQALTKNDLDFVAEVIHKYFNEKK